MLWNTPQSQVMVLDQSWGNPWYPWYPWLIYHTSFCGDFGGILNDRKQSLVRCVRQDEEQWLQHGAKTIWNRAAFLGQLKKAGVIGVDFCSIDLMCRVRKPAESEIGQKHNL